MKPNRRAWFAVLLVMIALPLLAQEGPSYAKLPLSAGPVSMAAAVALPTPPMAVASAAPALPDAPSTVGQLPEFNSAIAASIGQAPLPVGRGAEIEHGVIDARYLASTGLLYGSTVANIELTMRCRAAGACSMVPDGIAQRHMLYPITFAADSGISLLDYYLKSHHHRWWFVPAALITTGNAIYAVHAAKYIH
jgi:hypothetical protein